MWGAGKRTSLFIISYGPLAAMFMVLHWPSGWSATDMAELGLWLTAVAWLLVLPIAALSLTGRSAGAVLAMGSLIAGVVVILGVMWGWISPVALHQTAGRVSA